MTIDEYLAELRRHLRARPLAKRRILREVEAHLVDAAHAHGEERATASFGPPDQVAATFARARPRARARAVLAGVVVAATALALTLGSTGTSLHRASVCMGRAGAKQGQRCFTVPLNNVATYRLPDGSVIKVSPGGFDIIGYAGYSGPE